MRFNSSAVAAFCLSVGSAAAFSSPSFVSSRAIANARTSAASQPSSRHTAGCACPACVGAHTPGCTCSACLSSSHGAFCLCATCASGSATRLFSSSTEEEGVTTSAVDEEAVPPEVQAQDGILSDDEAHNSERPARASLKKKKTTRGKPLGELEINSTVPGKVKTITSYGAFVDIGASTDGLLHISNLSTGFVSDVKEFLQEGQDVQVRITNVDESKNQVGLTLLTEAEEDEAKQAARNQPRQNNNKGRNNDKRNDDSKVVSALAQKGWDPSQFVEGTVASTVDFGAFVRFDASQLNSEVEGEMDGLVHISALTAGRASSVTAIVNTGDKVQVRCKSIDGRKVSLTMQTVEQEEAQQEARRSAGVDTADTGAKDWKESLEKIKGDLPDFSNTPMVVDLRK